MHHISHHIIRHLTTAIIAMAIAGCSSHKHNATGGSATAPTATPEISTVADSYIYSLTSTYSDWDYLALPIDVELQSPQHIKLGGRMYMERDKSIYLSMRFLGMEVATLYLTNDTIYATEKIHKYYIAESVDQLLSGCDLTIGDLQNLLLGRAFVAGKGLLNQSMASELTIKPAGNGTSWSLTPPAIDGYTYTFNVDANPRHVRSIDFLQGTRSRATCTYSEPMRTRAGILPGTVSVNAAAGRTPLEISLQLDLREARWDAADIRRWNAPKGYTRLSRHELLSMLTSF